MVNFSGRMEKRVRYLRRLGGLVRIITLISLGVSMLFVLAFAIVLAGGAGATALFGLAATDVMSNRYTPAPTAGAFALNVFLAALVPGLVLTALTAVPHLVLWFIGEVLISMADHHEHQARIERAQADAPLFNAPPVPRRSRERDFIPPSLRG